MLPLTTYVGLEPCRKRRQRRFGLSDAPALAHKLPFQTAFLAQNLFGDMAPPL